MSCCSHEITEASIHIDILKLKDDNNSLILRKMEIPDLSEYQFYIFVDLNKGFIEQGLDFLYLIPEKAPCPNMSSKIKSSYRVELQRKTQSGTSAFGQMNIESLNLNEPQNSPKEKSLIKLAETQAFKLTLKLIHESSGRKDPSLNLNLVYEEDPDFYCQNIDFQLQAVFQMKRSGNNFFSPFLKSSTPHYQQTTSLSGFMTENPFDTKVCGSKEYSKRTVKNSISSRTSPFQTNPNMSINNSHLYKMLGGADKRSIMDRRGSNRLSEDLSLSKMNLIQSPDLKEKFAKSEKPFQAFLERFNQRENYDPKMTERNIYKGRNPLNVVELNPTANQDFSRAIKPFESKNSDISTSRGIEYDFADKENYNPNLLLSTSLEAFNTTESLCSKSTKKKSFKQSTTIGTPLSSRDIIHNNSKQNNTKVKRSPVPEFKSHPSPFSSNHKDSLNNSLQDAITTGMKATDLKCRRFNLFEDAGEVLKEENKVVNSHASSNLNFFKRFEYKSPQDKARRLYTVDEVFSVSNASSAREQRNLYFNSGISSNKLENKLYSHLEKFDQEDERDQQGLYVNAYNVLVGKKNKLQQSNNFQIKELEDFLKIYREKFEGIGFQLFINVKEQKLVFFPMNNEEVDTIEYSYEAITTQESLSNFLEQIFKSFSKKSYLAKISIAAEF